MYQNFTPDVPNSQFYGPLNFSHSETGFLDSLGGAPAPEIERNTDGELLRFGCLKVRNKIGNGGFGNVYQVEDPLTKKLYVLKIPSVKDYKENYSQILQDVIHEGRIQSLGNNSKHSVRILDFGSQRGIPFILSEFVQGCSLKFLEDQALERVTPYMHVASLIHVVRGLKPFHKAGVIHCDISLANILANIPEKRICISDFGTAVKDGAHMIDKTYMVGTGAYISPEQSGVFIGRNVISAATDVYALGAVLFHLVTGESFHIGKSEEDQLVSVLRGRTVDPEHWKMPKDIGEFLEKALKRNPDERFQSLDEVEHELIKMLPSPSVVNRLVKILCERIEEALKEEE